MKNIRRATINDLSRIAEIEIFNYRLNFYPIFKNDTYYFYDLQVVKLLKEYRDLLDYIWVYDDDVVKGFIQIDNQQIKKLFVEPILQGNSIGGKLLDFAIREFDANFLWVLEKNTRAIEFYQRHGFHLTAEKEVEEGTTEYLVRLER